MSYRFRSRYELQRMALIVNPNNFLFPALIVERLGDKDYRRCQPKTVEALDAERIAFVRRSHIDLSRERLADSQYERRLVRELYDKEKTYRSCLPFRTMRGVRDCRWRQTLDHPVKTYNQRQPRVPDRRSS
jgi:hypothetical protein